MTTIIRDAAERQRALDPSSSFIIQAPAGSGKTELLTQRLLVLLGNVKLPEEILAITFTKKSAAEMRMRIMTALNNAFLGEEPTAPHAKATWLLAKKVLVQNEKYNWNLLGNPNRLRIQTIDAFNTFLPKQLPVLSQFGASPEITDDATALYREAVQEFLSHLEDDLAWSDAIATMLLHMDNDLNSVETLLVNLLAKRDQWLPYITLNSNDPLLREKLEAHLASVIEDVLSVLENSFPKNHIAEFILLARYAGNNLINEGVDSLIVNCAELNGLPEVSAENKETWLSIRELLLTKENNWRKTVDKRQGFPADKKFSEYKLRMLDLLVELNQHDQLLNAFSELSISPEGKYQENQ